PHPRRRRRRNALAIAAAVAVIGGGTGVAVTLSGGGSGRSRAAAAHRPAGPAVAAAANGHPSSTNRAGDGVITVEMTNNLGTHYRVAIHDLRRAGPFVTLDVALTCQSKYCFPSIDFAAPGPALAGEGAFNGLGLIDTVGGAEYQPVADSQGRSYSSRMVDLDDGQTEAAWATFAAPPSSETAMDLVIDGGGTWAPAVPITEVGAPNSARWGSGVIAAHPVPFDVGPDATTSAGLTLPVLTLSSTVGNPRGNDNQSGDKATITLNADVLFAFGQATLSPPAQQILQGVAARLKSAGRGAVNVSGYTDSIGDDSVNIPLSQARAQAVTDALTPLTAGAPITFGATGMGSANPVSPNTNSDGSDNPAGRAANRRVTITYTVSAPTPPTPPAAAPPPAATSSANHSVEVTINEPDLNTSYAYTVAASRLVRSGRYVVLEGTITCDNETPTRSAGCDSSYALAASSGSTVVPPQPDFNIGTAGTSLNTDAFYTASGVYLVDPTGQQYIAVRNPSDKVLTAAFPTSFTASDPFAVWEYFPAPPPSVTSMNVVMPGGSPVIANVPIVSG
ncbi:MAG: OmpA family protein, partial [Actinomycetota bacterium]|nr:OmpA family protein [Actinomycetota bacterium]